MASHRRELFLVIIAVCLAWLAIVIGLSKWQQSHRRTGAGAEPNLPHYPGTESVQEQTAPSLGWRKYWFTLNEDYPSKSAFYFYRNQLEPQGWRRTPEAEPQWLRPKSKEEAQDLFHATWVSPNRLFQIDLDMVSSVTLLREGDHIVGEERKPGIKVYVTLRRVLTPSLLMSPKQPESWRSEIEAR